MRRVELRFGRHVHPVYREQLLAAPAGWSYVGDHPSLGDVAAPTKRISERGTRWGSSRERAEFIALRALSAAGYVHRIRARPGPGVSLIHSAERLLWRSPLPYVLDLEHVDLFVLYQQAAFDRSWTRPLLESALLDERLKFLLPWSDAARRSVLKVVSPDVAKRLEPKLRTVHPAARLLADRPRSRGKGPLRLLFVGTMFYEKGGVDAVMALREARTTHNVELDVVTYPPAEWARPLEEEPGLRLHTPGGQDIVRGLYARADALLFPSHMDTYGVVVGEAMGHGLPVLAPGHLALNEIVIDEVSGLLFSAENMLWRDDTTCAFSHTLPQPDHYLQALRSPSSGYVSGIAGAMTRLAEEAGLYERLAAGAWESVRNGHLSITRRRGLLKDIYDTAA